MIIKPTEEEKEFFKSQGTLRYTSKRNAGIPQERYDGSKTCIENDIQAAAAEKFAAEFMGQSYNDKIMKTGDGGADFKLNIPLHGEKTVEVVWLGVDKSTNKPRKTGNLIVNPEEPQRWADIYMVVSGSLDEGFRVRGWTSHKKLTSASKKDFGYGKKFALHIDMLWEVSTLKKLL